MPQKTAKKPGAEKATKPAAPKAQPKDPAAPREVVHPEFVVKKFFGKDAVGAKWFKKAMGWEKIPEGAGKDAVPVLTDLEGNRIRCLKNLSNRPFDLARALGYAQDILNKNWADSRWGEGRTHNGETMVIGRYDNVISMQHRAAAVILADQLWYGKGEVDQSAHWKEIWPDGPPTIEALVVYGVDESPETVRTVDNIKPRTWSDVLFTDPTVFGSWKLPPAERKTVTRMVDYCVRFLWHRTGADKDAFTPRRTHSEADRWARAHPRVFKAVRHVYSEYGKGERWKLNTERMGPGTAAGVLYLMAASASDVNDYLRGKHPRTEKAVDFAEWDRACEFWSRFCGITATAGDLALKPVLDAWYSLVTEDSGARPPLAHKLVVLAKAWALYRAGGPLDPDALAPETAPDPETGAAVIVDNADFGGIDSGEPERRVREAPAADAPPAPDPEEVKREERKRLIKERQEKMRRGKGAGGTASDGEGGRTSAPLAEPRSLSDELDTLKEQYGDAVLLFRTSEGYQAWREDAAVVAQHCRLSLTRKMGLEFTVFPAEKLADYTAKLTGVGRRVAVVEPPGAEAAPKVGPPAEGGASPPSGAAPASRRERKATSRGTR
jgi:hypothetical protein